MSDVQPLTDEVKWLLDRSTDELKRRQAEIESLRQQLADVTAERDILRAFFPPFDATVVKHEGECVEGGGGTADGLRQQPRRRY